MLGIKTTSFKDQSTNIVVGVALKIYFLGTLMYIYLNAYNSYYIVYNQICAYTVPIHFDISHRISLYIYYLIVVFVLYYAISTQFCCIHGLGHTKNIAYIYTNAYTQRGCFY